MKLCHIVPSLQLEHGGPSRSVRALCGALSRAGEEVELLTTHPRAPASGTTERTTEGLTIRTFRRDWPQRVCPSRGLAQAVAASDARLVHHHGLWLRTLHYASRLNAPLVISPRGMTSEWAWRHHRTQKALAGRLIHPGALARADAWHATSAQEVAEIRAQGFTQPVGESPNGVDLPTPADLQRARDYWGKACPELHGRRVALFYSRLHRKKRVRELITLWGHLNPPGWCLLIVGIPEEYGINDLREASAIDAPGASIRIYDGTDAPPPYPLADLFLLPSHNENFGLTIAEAMAHGLPVVVTDTTPWAEVNRHEAGWCVPWAAYPHALEEALAMSADTLAQKGARARLWTMREYSWDQAARRLLVFYRSLKGVA